MTPKSKALWVGCVTFVLTGLVTIFKEIELSNVNTIWIIWTGLSWNYFAYAFDRGMWPRAFIELDGGGKGKPGHRTFYFWGTAAVHLAFLGTAAFAGS